MQKCAGNDVKKNETKVLVLSLKVDLVKVVLKLLNKETPFLFKKHFLSKINLVCSTRFDARNL